MWYPHDLGYICIDIYIYIQIYNMYIYIYMSMFPAPLVCGVGVGLRGCEETTFQTECGQLLDSICANCELEAGSWLMMG